MTMFSEWFRLWAVHDNEDDIRFNVLSWKQKRLQLKEFEQCLNRYIQEYKERKRRK